MPFVSGVPGRQSTSLKPASSANLHARSTFRLLPPEKATRADMLSVTHSSGMPPKVRKASSRHASRSSVVLVLVGMKRCLRECPSVPDHTLNSKTSPFASASLTSSFQSNCSWRPGGVSKRGCASGEGEPKATPCLRHHAVNAP